MKWIVPNHSLVNRNSILDDFDHFVDSFLTPVSSESLNFKPACDINESDEHYLASFDLPGVKKEDINVEIKDNHLVISGERQKELNNKKSGHFERSYGKFQRVFSLPEKVDPQSVEASFENGVLELVIPKSKEAKAHKIEIGTKSSGSIFSKALNSKKEGTETN